MGRKSLAKKLYEGIVVDEDPGQTWLVVYDFLGVKPSPNFWSNLQRLSGMLEDGALTQYSVFRTSDLRGAVVAGLLAQHYGAQILFFRAEEARLEEYFSWREGKDPL